MSALTVFDIQKFALQDGPGIRTTVFLKGCPLDCLWCHNPESKSMKPQLGFIEKNCVMCGRCQEICSCKVHSIVSHDMDNLQNYTHNIDFSKCISCGRCVEECLSGALKIFGKKMTSDEIMETVIKDKDFFERSGGGLTVSGGEPMMQFEGLLELLQKAKVQGLHTCLDTSGFAKTENYKEIAPYVDLFLFDYKITDGEEHKKYTGVDNPLILNNLKYLSDYGSEIYLRCPIIPGINDNDAHYKAISALSQKFAGIKQVNLMMYHDMAKGKSSQLGEAYPLEHLETISDSEKQRITEEVRKQGCLNLISV